MMLSFAALALLSQSPLPPGFPEDLEIIKANEVMIGASSPLLRHTIRFGAGSQEFTVTRRERDSTTGPFHEVFQEHSVSYFLCDVAPRRAGMHLFVAGVRANGNSIVERWVWDEQALEGRIGLLQSPVPPLGTPQGSYYGDLQVIGAGFVPTARIPPPGKSVVYEGELGPFSSVEVDPEGRYLLLHSSSDKSIYRLDFGGSPAPVQVLTVADLPSLADVTRISAFNYEGEGRIVVLSTLAYGNLDALIRTHWRDLDNDGNFDDLQTYDWLTFFGSPYFDSGLWKEPWDFN